jgi:hypothetical protein
MLSLDYESEGFPAGAPVVNGAGVLDTTWDEILWSAITVGRPNRQHVFRHGLASTYEALFRLSLVRMAIEQAGPTARRLRRTAAAKSLDPSEKGAVNYFMGMITCKLFAARLLNAPWMLHLDVFRPLLNPILSGRSRPDLIGQIQGGGWLAFESKGRVSQPDADAKTKAKQQARRCVSVGAVPVTYHIGGIMYFRNEVLRFFWRDPPADDPANAFRVSVDSDAWRHYYRPALQIVRMDGDAFDRMLRDPIIVPVSAADIEIGIHPDLLRLLDKNLWGEAKGWCEQNVSALENQGYQRDGIRVTAGRTWLSPFNEAEPILQ